MARHPTLYFSDGTVTIKVVISIVITDITDLSKAGDGSDTIYNVYRGPLLRGSELFEGMLNLPHPGIAPMTLTDNAKEWFEHARKLGMDGTSDDLAVMLPPQLTAGEIEIFLNFMFLQG